MHEMTDQNNSVFALVYKDENFFFLEKRHSVANLLKLGFLLCQFQSEEDQELELWHLINPKLYEAIHVKVVEEFFRDLVYIALDMNLCKCKSVIIIFRFIKERR